MAFNSQSASLFTEIIIFLERYKSNCNLNQFKQFCLTQCCEYVFLENKKQIVYAFVLYCDKYFSVRLITFQIMYAILWYSNMIKYFRKSIFLY